MENKEELMILGRCGMKYINKDGVEYFLNGEMIINENYDFVVSSDEIQFYEDYLRKYNGNNINLVETYDKNKKCIVGKFEFRNTFDSNISKIHLIRIYQKK